MSKAEDKAKEFLKKLVSHTTLYKDTIDELEVYEPDDIIWAYKEGYHQAEFDLRLTWEDIVEIDKLLIDLGMMFPDKSTPDYYKEVLKRFIERKER